MFIVDIFWDRQEFDNTSELQATNAPLDQTHG